MVVGRDQPPNGGECDSAHFLVFAFHKVAAPIVM